MNSLIRLMALLAFSLLLIFTQAAMAKNLGVVGKVYDIQEPDMLEEIKAELSQMEANGEIAQMQKDMQLNMQQYVVRPPPVPGIVHTETPRTFYFDPTITLEQDIKDAEGRIIFPAGTSVNPLNMMALSRHMLFFDGDSPEQVEWAKQLYEHYDGRVKMILTNGPVLALSEQMQTQVYFDQRGILVNKFGIQQVPAIVSQENSQIRIDEVKP